jgi:hypothetical protein
MRGGWPDSATVPASFHREPKRTSAGAPMFGAWPPGRASVRLPKAVLPGPRRTSEPPPPQVLTVSALHNVALPDSEAGMAAQRTKMSPTTRACDPPEPGHDEVWVEVRGRRVHGVFSVADGWVEVIADNGMTKTARCGESSAAAVAERLLRELHRREPV